MNYISAYRMMKFAAAKAEEPDDVLDIEAVGNPQEPSKPAEPVDPAAPIDWSKVLYTESTKDFNRKISNPFEMFYGGSKTPMQVINDSLITAKRPLELPYLGVPAGKTVVADGKLTPQQAAAAEKGDLSGLELGADAEQYGSYEEWKTAYRDKRRALNVQLSDLNRKLRQSYARKEPRAKQDAIRAQLKSVRNASQLLQAQLDAGWKGTKGRKGSGRVLSGQDALKLRNGTDRASSRGMKIMKGPKYAFGGHASVPEASVAVK